MKAFLNVIEPIWLVGATLLMSRDESGFDTHKVIVILLILLVIYVCGISNRVKRILKEIEIANRKATP